MRDENKHFLPGELDSVQSVTRLCHLCKINFRVQWSNPTQDMNSGISESCFDVKVASGILVEGDAEFF